MVKELRDQTGAGMMDCKQALEESGGDLDKATVLLRERGIAKAAKRAGRETAAGLVEAYLHRTRPAAVSRPARLAALAMPRSRRSTVAFSRSPPDSSRACLQSIMPAPVWSRSSFTIPAVISTT